MITIKTLIGSLGLIGLFNGIAEANPSIIIETLGEFPATKQALVRLTESSDLPLGLTAFGLGEFEGRGSQGFYSEVNLSKDIYSGIGGRLEWNGGSDITDVLRFGPTYTFKPLDELYLDFKAYPLNLSMDRKLVDPQIGLFARLDLPREIYLENWTDLNIGDNALLQSELLVGKKLAERLSLQTGAIYNVSVPNKVEGRAGFRYEF